MTQRKDAVVMSIILGILAGIGLPVQTSINTALRKKVGSPYNASLVSFVVALLFLVLLLLVTGQGIYIPVERLFVQEPGWIWAGGLCGVIFLTGNILLLTKVGSVQTVILPVLGQILMGLVVDSLGLFYAVQSKLTLLRAGGAVLVVAGVLIVSLAKKSKNPGTSQAVLPEGERAGQPVKIGNQGAHLWLWQIFGILAGMLSATQTAINGYLGKVLASPVKASVISFIIGIIFLEIVCVIMFRIDHSAKTSRPKHEKHPWWIWFGGVLGGLYILANVVLSGQIGTGMTVIVLLVGATSGGLLVDHFGLFGTDKKPINAVKLLGVLVMIAGAAAIKLF